jgi:hypothetical protein
MVGRTVFRGNLCDLHRADVDHRILEHHETLAASGNQPQGITDVCGRLDLDVVHVDVRGLRRRLDPFHGRPVDGIARVPDDGDTVERRNGFLE